MSRLDELIEKLCPNGVEWKELGEVCEFRRGAFPQPYGNTKWYGGENSMPFVQVADVDDNFNLVANTKHRISTIAIEKSVFVKRGTVIVTLQGTIGRVAITQYDCYIDRTIALFQDYKIDINKKYFAYQLKQKFDCEKKTARGSTLKTITKEEFTKFKIPIPPLEIQEEIVHILDSFTELTIEITAELTARRKQYEFYRDSLLTFGDEVEWKKLEDVFVIKNGYTPSKSNSEYWENGTVPWFRMDDIRQNGRILCDSIQHVSEQAIKGNLFPANSIILSTSATIGEHALIEIEFLANQRFTSLVKKDSYKDILNMKFMFYYCFIIGEWCKENVILGNFPSVEMNRLKNYKIPLPPLHEQERIVSILDKFDKLCNDISEGLPAEIEARKKQYEHYRDKLLNFEELKKS